MKKLPGKEQKELFSKLNSIRQKAKTVNYAALYGVSPAGLVRNSGLPLEEAKILLNAFWKKNWSIKAVVDGLEVKVVGGQRWLYNPISKIWYSLRTDKDKFSTLNQGTGVYCFDMWIKEFRSKRPQLTGQFHDEVVLCIKEGHREEATSLLKWAIQQVNEKLKLNRELDVDVQYGRCYADIH